jgi:hypothetical protein
MRRRSTRLRSAAGLAAAAAIAIAVIPATAQAQSAQPRVRISVSGGVQSPASTVSDRITFQRNIETETIDVKYPKTPGVLVDVGFGVRLWKNLGVGVAVGHVTGDGTADVTASVPHPFLFNQPRTVTGKQGGMSREQTDLHLQVQYMIPASSRLRIVLGAGPSHLKLTQDVVIDVNVTETYPYDTAAFRDAATKGESVSVSGFNAGLDATWSLTRHVGFGGLVRYTRADADLDIRTDHRLSMKAGGAQAAAGIRFAF